MAEDVSSKFEQIDVECGNENSRTRYVDTSYTFIYGVADGVTDDEVAEFVEERFGMFPWHDAKPALSPDRKRLKVDVIQYYLD